MTNIYAAGNMAFQVSPKELMCPSCKKEFVNPKLLNCLHTFCQPCIATKIKMIQKGLFTITCPFCKSVTKSTNSSGRDLPTNVYITGLLQIIASRNNIPFKCVVCSITHRRTNASHRCLDCGDALCQPCSKGHNSSTSTSGHMVVSVEELRKGRFNVEIMRRQSSRCALHKSDYRFYCNNCSCLVCEQCAITEHKFHEHKDLEAALKEKSETLDKLFPQNHPVRVIAKRVNALEKQEREFRKSLTLDVIDMVERLHKERKEILKESRKIFEEERNLLVSHMATASIGTAGFYTRVLGIGGNQLLAMSSFLESALKAMPKSYNTDSKLPPSKEVSANIAGYCPGKQIITLVVREVGETCTDQLPLQEESGSKDILEPVPQNLENETKVVPKNNDSVEGDKEKTVNDRCSTEATTNEPKDDTGKKTDKPVKRVSFKDIEVGKSDTKCHASDPVDTKSIGDDIIGTKTPGSFAAEFMGNKGAKISENVPDVDEAKASENEDKDKISQSGVSGKLNSEHNKQRSCFLNTSVTTKQTETNISKHNRFGTASLSEKKNQGLLEDKDSWSQRFGTKGKEETGGMASVGSKTCYGKQDSQRRFLMYRKHFKTWLKSDKLTPSISCLAFGPDDSILVLDENNCKVQVFDKNCNCTNVARKTHEMFFSQITVYSHGFASAHDQMLLFCRKDFLVNKAIYFFTDKGDHKLKYLPLVCNFQDNLLVGNLPDNEMRIYNEHGKIQRSWKSHVPGPFISMKYAQKDRVVLSTWANHGAVYIESETEGIVLEIYRGICVGDRVEAWYPWDACVTSSGCVIVSDSLRDEISVFSPEGTLMGVTNTKENNISEPRCLLLDKYNRLFVSAGQGVVVQYNLCNV